MSSKEALEIIKKYDDYASIRFLTKGIVSPKTMGSPNEEDFKEAIDIIEQDLQTLENIKNKTNLFFSQRKQIAKEFNCWCVENNADALDSTNLVTWLLCFKLKEWLE